MTEKPISQIEEIWKPVLGFELTYEVSNLGRVRGKKRNSPSIGYKAAKGYLKFELQKYPKKHSRFVHRMVMESFIGKSHLTVNHKNMIKTDNRLDNLEYVTSPYNTFLAVLKKHGTSLGVRFTNGKYRAKINFNKKPKLYGYYDNPLEAHMRYLYECNKSLPDNEKTKLPDNINLNDLKRGLPVGVGIHKQSGKYVAYYKKKSRGVFDSIEEAHEARKKLEIDDKIRK